MGGAGSACAEALADAAIVRPILHLGLPDLFIDHGDPSSLLAAVGLDAAGITASIRDAARDDREPAAGGGPARAAARRQQRLKPAAHAGFPRVRKWRPHRAGLDEDRGGRRRRTAFPAFPTAMNAPEPLKSFSFDLPDVQGAADLRHLAIQRVGIKGVRHPLTVRNADGRLQQTVGTWSLDVHLPETRKGTHMSRFVALMEEQGRSRGVLDVVGMRALLSTMAERLDAQAGRIEVRFPFFITKAAPVSGVESMLDIEVSMVGRIDHGTTDVALTVVVPVTSLCPCSKEISDYGAHNQRSHVTIEAAVADGDEITVEELVRIAEEEASCEVYGLLKRPDEKYVTERAYENPKFVEDLIRDVVQRLNDEPRVTRYVVEVENFESIHNHSAYARIERGPTT